LPDPGGRPLPPHTHCRTTAPPTGLARAPRSRQLPANHGKELPRATPPAAAL